MTSPLVSVVIPAFNSASTIGRAVRSVVDQTFTDWELIVVDDGSSDDLRTALEEFGNIVNLVRQANKGAGAARNFGASLARGEYLAFLDADDYWHPEKLQLQVDALRSHPDIALCGTGHRRSKSGTVQIKCEDPLLRQIKPKVIRDFGSFFGNPYLGTPGVMMRLGIFRSLGGFRTDIRAAEDVDLWLRAAFHGGVVFIPAPLFTVVTSSNSLTARLQDGTYRDNLRVIDDFCLSWPEFSSNHARLVRRTKSAILRNWGADAYIRGELDLARGVLFKSVVTDPTMSNLWMLAKTLFRQAFPR